MPYSVWNTAPTTAPHQRRGRYLPGSSAHPAKMLPGIAAHAIHYYTRPGDLVFDPMCGIGTTLVEAIHQGRNALGVEYERRWANTARANLHHAINHMRAGHGEVIHGDARNLEPLIAPAFNGRVALVVTSPPYGGSLHGRVRTSRESGSTGVRKFNGRYGRDPRNLAHADIDQLVAAFTRMLRQVSRLLQPSGTVVVTARPWRERGELIDLPTGLLAAGRNAGLVATERCAALLAGIRDDHLVLRPSFFQMKNVRDARRQGLPLHLIAHEDVLVFRRPGAAATADLARRGAESAPLQARPNRRGKSPSTGG